MNWGTMRRQNRERGAAAVEFALVVPLLLMLMLGIAEFGRAYSTQTILSGAAREGVRVMALQNSTSAARTAAIAAAAPTLSLTTSQIGITTSPTSTPISCASGGQTTITITYSMPYLSDFFGSSITLKGTGVMRCNG
ncbi:MAG TPA: TadE family protein [Propionibacteriaceae bacterium]|jgi:Flp pilus assembly protein TadG